MLSPVLAVNVHMSRSPKVMVPVASAPLVSGTAFVTRRHNERLGNLSQMQHISAGAACIALLTSTVKVPLLVAV